MEGRNYNDGLMNYLFPETGTKPSRTPLKSICDISSLIDKGKLEKVFADEDRTLAELSIYLGTTKSETVLFCLIFALNYDSGESVDISRVARAANVSTVRMLQMNEKFLSLCKKGLCSMTKTRSSHSRMALKETYFSVTREVSRCIIENKPIEVKPQEEADKNDMIQFLLHLSDVINGGCDPLEDESDSIEGEYMIEEVTGLEDEISDNEQLKKLQAVIPSESDRMLFYLFCINKIVNYEDDTDLITAVRRIHIRPMNTMKEAQKFIDGTNSLVKAELVELNNTAMLSTATVSVTEEGLELLLGSEAELYKKRVNIKDMINPADIHAKKLFYSEKTGGQIDMLRSALEETRFVKLRTQLKEKGLPCGIAVLLYGGPGTGKTETVYQIAKQTGRAIVHVDIAATKSCWFGESEKIIRALFKKYKKLCADSIKDGTLMPILFLNEADAIISKRRSIDSSGTAQTENTIQNIILEELETLDGIMIATTNLADNMDAAFERRFLFKVSIDQPTEEARQKIWQDKISSLSDDDARTLARTYDFSGGEIDNIVRKIEIESIIKDTPVSFAEIDKLCGSEKIKNDTTRSIGFGN